MAMGRAQTEEGKNQNLQAAGWVDFIDVECEKTAFARKSLWTLLDYLDFCINWCQNLSTFWSSCNNKQSWVKLKLRRKGGVLCFSKCVFYTVCKRSPFTQHGPQVGVRAPWLGHHKRRTFLWWSKFCWIYTLPYVGVVRLFCRHPLISLSWFSFKMSWPTWEFLIPALTTMPPRHISQFDGDVLQHLFSFPTTQFWFHLPTEYFAGLNVNTWTMRIWDPSCDWL